MNDPLPTGPSSELMTIWEGYRPTRLIELPELARLTGVGHVLVKAEWERPLGNFKALGGMVAGLRALARVSGASSLRDLISNHASRAVLPRLICASDGNHGLAVAAAARRAGARASIYLPAFVDRSRADRIEALGGDVIRVAGTYDDAVDEARKAAVSRGEGLLIPDTTSNPYDRVVGDVMAGYALLTDEISTQLEGNVRSRPGHLFVQAGVGGLAAAMANGLWDLMRPPRKLLVVEPESAACVALALSAGRPVRLEGDLHTCAEMLSCGLASAPALEVLRRYEARSVLATERQLRIAVDTLRQVAGLHTTPSGAAGFAGLLRAAASPELRTAHCLGPDSSVLLVVTEGLVVDDERSSTYTGAKCV